MASAFQSDSFQSDTFDTGTTFTRTVDDSLASITEDVSRTATTFRFVTDSISSLTEAISRAAASFTRAVEDSVNSLTETVAATVTSLFTADAIILKENSGGLTADAIIQATASTTFSADAALRATLSQTFTADGLLRTIPTASFTANSVLQNSVSAQLNAFGIIRRIESASLTADAYLVKTLSGSFTANAYLKLLSERSFTANAVIFRPSESPSTPGRLKKRSAITISQKRAADFYFQRVHDVFERKFDGFPAQILAKPSSTLKDAAGNIRSIDPQQLAEEIKKQIQQEQLQNKVVSCDPVAPVFGTSGSTILEDDLIGGPITYFATNPVKYWVKVWFDATPAIRGVDWDNCDGNLCALHALPTGTIVSAEYVML